MKELHQVGKVITPAVRESGTLDRLKRPEIIGTVEGKELECYHFWKLWSYRSQIPGAAKPPQGRIRRLQVRVLGDKKTVKAA